MSVLLLLAAHAAVGAGFGHPPKAVDECGGVGLTVIDVTVPLHPTKLQLVALLCEDPPRARALHLTGWRPGCWKKAYLLFLEQHGPLQHYSSSDSFSTWVLVGTWFLATVATGHTVLVSGSTWVLVTLALNEGVMLVSSWLGAHLTSECPPSAPPMPSFTADAGHPPPCAACSALLVALRLRCMWDRCF